MICSWCGGDEDPCGCYDLPANESPFVSRFEAEMADEAWDNENSYERDEPDTAHEDMNPR